MEQLILIVDDQPQNLQVLSTTLRQAGYQVAAANSGPTAIRILDRRQPDLVLCDVVMPGMDGYELCRRLKALPQGRDIPLMFVTARSDSQAIMEGFESGAVDFVLKPFNTPELLARVRTQLDLRQARLTILDYARRMDELAQSDQELRSTAAELKANLEVLLQQVGELEKDSATLSQAELSGRLQAIQQQIGQVLDQFGPLLEATKA
ncbi:MAG TPA: response regulator [Candidatus Obscuribacterales bacterium]